MTSFSLEKTVVQTILKAHRCHFMTTYLSIMVICNYKLILNNLQSFKNKQKSFIVSKGDRADIKNTQVSPKKVNFFSSQLIFYIM